MNKKMFVCYITHFCLFVNCFAQLNFGLQQRQKESELPKSRSLSIGKLNRTITRVHDNAKSGNSTAGTYIINSDWFMIDESGLLKNTGNPLSPNVDMSGWYKATVPGTVLTTLVDNGIYPDPYWGINNVSIPDTLCRMNWWYRTEFMFPENLKKFTNHILTFNGINYKAQIWLNNHLLGNINGAFSRGIFNVSKYLDYNGKNVLVVKIIPPFNPGISHEQSLRAVKGPNGGALCMDGPTFISSEGWDWMPTIKDRNIGIWQDVTISFHGNVSSENIHVVTDLNLPDTTHAEIVIEMDLVNHSDMSQDASVEFEIDDIKFKRKYILNANKTEKVRLTRNEVKELYIKNPKLWWPNGYGNQHLYTLKVRTSDKSGLTDYKTIKFGVRELEYELAVNTKEDEIKRIKLNPLKAYSDGCEIIDRINKKSIGKGLYVPQLICNLDHPGITNIAGDSPYIVFIVNGKRIFCKGGNWGMDDAMKRQGKEDLRKYFELHKGQHFNMIRNWTGESTQESFYELCDEYGMLVFNDFWMSTENYNLPPLDHKLFEENVREVIIRYRNHPSIAVWCPRNEGFAPVELEKSITEMLANLDGTRYYIGNSRLLNTINSGPWDFRRDEFYFKMAEGFASEIGTFSIPVYRSLDKFMSKEDQWPIGDVWCYHDWHTTEWPNFIEYNKYINKVYTQVNDAKTFCDISQIQGFDSYRAMFEAWNSKMWNNTSGILLWMSHPAWPSTIWQTYTWDGETTGAFYGCRKACEKLHLQFNPITKKIESVNLGEKRNVLLKYEIYTLDGKLITSSDKKVQLSCEKTEEQFDLSKFSTEEDLYLLRLSIIEKSNIISVNDYWLNSTDVPLRKALLDIDKTNVVAKVKGYKNGKTLIEVMNNGNDLAIGVKLSLLDTSTGDFILPAIFSDGYFNLLPKEKRQITIEQKIESEQIFVEYLNSI